MPIPKTIERAFKSDNTLSNRIVFFLSGIFFSAIFFLLMLKYIGTWGVYLALAISLYCNFWLKKYRKQKKMTNAFNNGAITFNIITIIISLTLLVAFFGSMQNLLN